MGFILKRATSNVITFTTDVINADIPLNTAVCNLPPGFLIYMGVRCSQGNCTYNTNGTIRLIDSFARVLNSSVYPGGTSFSVQEVGTIFPQNPFVFTGALFIAEWTPFDVITPNAALQFRFLLLPL